MRIAIDLEPLMSVAQMSAADAAAPTHGVPSMSLMESAGRAVADEIGKRFTPRVTAVMCGPGNNGGDGFVVARLLKERGWRVWVEFAYPTGLKGDAAEAFRRWDGDTWFSPPDKPTPDLYIDALFGAGLSRPLSGSAALFAEASARFPQAIVAIDVPSGIHGDTGQTLGGPAIHAGLTVTFVRRKPGHLLMPGRAHCGEIVCADIGMPGAALRGATHDAPMLSTICGAFAVATDPTAHKYDRGHCLVVSGGSHTTGASRLAAHAAARAGAGLTTIAAPDRATDAIHAARLDAIMVRSEPLDELLKDPRRNALIIGPGLGLDVDAEAKVNAVLAACRATVLDADALTLIAKSSPQATPLTHDLCVMTPHAGEFARLFPDIAAGVPQTGKLEATRAASKRAGCVVVFKGADTVIAAPDGRAVIDSLSPSTLATAGSGDVLSGLIGGLLAQSLSTFDAACAAVFLHGAAARSLGPGLTADDLPNAVPMVLAALPPKRRNA